MANDKKESKLTNKLEVRFTDFAIDNFDHSFEFEDEKGRFTKDQLTIPLVDLGPKLKGLKFNYYRKKKTKYFILSYWYNKKSLTLPCGLFRKRIYGTKEVEEYLTPIVKACTNEHGFWEKDPKVYLKEEKIKEEAKRKIKSVNKIIEMVCEDNFPKTKIDGTLSAIQIRSNCRTLLGYNFRTTHLIFTEDDLGNGLIRFKPEGPQSFNELFNKYPPGEGIIKYDPHLNPNRETSVYDSAFGTKPIIEIVPGDVEDYINRKDRSVGYRENLLDTLSHLWSYSRQHKERPLGRTPPLNPCRKVDGGITIKKGRKSKFKGSYLNDMTFSPQILNKIVAKLWTTECINKWGFRALALLFIRYSGKRETESLKVKTSDIDWKHKEITIRLNKMRKNEVVDIDPDIQRVLDKRKELIKEKFGKINKKIFSIKSLQWLFPSSRINVLELHNDEYVKGEQTRLKRLDSCMKWVKKELNIPGSMKTFRKAFDSNAIYDKKLTSEELSAVTGQSPQVINKNYMKATREVRKKLKEKIRT